MDNTNPIIEEKVKEFKKVIWNANPSILELKFGCRISMQEDFGMLVKGQVYTVRGNDEQRFIEIGPEDKYQCEFINGLPKCAILGRPIRLADVLIAFRGPVVGWAGKPLQELIAVWNIYNENLDNQSDECKQFLYDLLIKQ